MFVHELVRIAHSPTTAQQAMDSKLSRFRGVLLDFQSKVWHRDKHRETLEVIESADLFLISGHASLLHATIYISSPTVSAMLLFRTLSLALLVAYASAWQPMKMSTSSGTMKVCRIRRCSVVDLRRDEYLSQRVRKRNCASK